MSREYSFNCLGVDGKFQGPATAVEIERAVGVPGIVEDTFMQQYAYQDRNVSMRAAVAKEVENLTGVPRKTKPDGKGYEETEQGYINRVTTAAEEGATPALSNADLLRIWHAANEALGPWSATSISDRKPAKQFYEIAEGYLAKIAAGSQTPKGAVYTIELVVQGLEAKGGFNFESTFGEPTVDNLARAVKAVHEKAIRDAGAI